MTTKLKTGWQALALAGLFLAACANNNPTSAGGSGGKSAAGGDASGGQTSASGGQLGLGGNTSTTGSTAKGGTTTSGGNGGASTTASGGAGAGGVVGSGGTTGGGGVIGSGGTGLGGTPWLKVVGNQIQVEATGQQVILRGVSGQSISSQGTQALVDYFTNTKDTAGTSPGWYVKLLRLPIDPGDAMNEVNNGKLKASVDACTKKDLYCIIDLHYVADPYANKDAVTKFWTAVAPMFVTYPNVIYEIYNESSVQDTWAKYKPTMQEWVNLVRKAAPKNLIFAGSPSWDQTMGDAGEDGLTGENIVYVVHMYEEHWCDPKNGFVEWTGPNSNKGNVERCAKYHPVVMTEWGFNHTDANAASKQPGSGTDIIGHYGTPMLTWLEGLGGSWTAWCASSNWLPRMFSTGGPPNWVLTNGQDEMGVFVKDWLYKHRNEKPPAAFP